MSLGAAMSYNLKKADTALTVGMQQYLSQDCFIKVVLMLISR